MPINQVTSLISAQDTFTETITINSVLVLLFLIIFGIIKQIFPSFFQPLLITQQNWIINVLETPLAKYVERGNLAVVFIIMQQMLTSLFLTVSFYCICILGPWYFFGNSQRHAQSNFWAHIQITSIEDRSFQSIFPILVCCLLVYEFLVFYSNVSVVYTFYKQQVLRRAAPHNFVLMLDNLPKELRNIYALRKTMRDSFPDGLEMIVPVAKNNVSLFWQGFHLVRLIKRYHRMKRHVFIWKAKLDYYLIKLESNNNWWNRMLTNRAKNNYNRYMKQTLKAKIRAHRRKQRIFKIQTREDLDVSYLSEIEQLYPPFPESVKSFKFIDINEQAIKNNVVLTTDNQKVMQKQEHFLNIQQQLDENQKQDDQFILSSVPQEKALPQVFQLTDQQERKINQRISRLGKACFLVFKSQKLASLASRAVLFMDNTAPSIQLAPHPDQILWYNINATKLSRILSEFIFWIMIIVLFALFFVPQVILISAFNSGQALIMDFLKNICSDLFCDANSDGINCKLCQICINLIITYLPTLIQAIFLSLLPQFITLLLFIPKYKSKTKRNVSMYICMFVFLILMQGIFDVVLGAATNQNGVIQIDQFFQTSVQQALIQMGTNLSSQSFSFLNYVLTKYFFFSVLSLLRIPDVFLVIFKLIFFKDMRLRSRIYKFNPFNFVLHLAYMSHMCVIGLMYCITSPISSLVILFGLLSLMLVDRYNILYVHQQFPEADMSSEVDVIKVFINNIFIGFILMVCAVFAYVLTNWSGYSLYIYSLLLVSCIVCLVMGKISIDTRYSQSISSLHMGTFEPKGIFSALLQKYKFSQVSYIKRISVLFKEYITVPANKESTQPYELTKRDVDHIACYYTQPGISVANIYPSDEHNKDVI